MCKCELACVRAAGQHTRWWTKRGGAGRLRSAAAAAAAAAAAGLALIFNLSNPRKTILQVKKRLQVARYSESFTVFLEDQFELIAQWSRQSLVSQGTWLRISQGA